MTTADKLDDALDIPVRVQFWTCPIREHKDVEWHGDVALCGCGRTSENPVLSAQYVTRRLVEMLNAADDYDAHDLMEQTLAERDHFVRMYGLALEKAREIKAERDGINRANIANAKRLVDERRKRAILSSLLRGMARKLAGQRRRTGLLISDDSKNRNEIAQLRAELGERTRERDDAVEMVKCCLGQSDLGGSHASVILGLRRDVRNAEAATNQYRDQVVEVLNKNAKLVRELGETRAELRELTAQANADLRKATAQGGVA